MRLGPVFHAVLPNVASHLLLVRQPVLTSCTGHASYARFV